MALVSLIENLNYDQANIITESSTDGKSLYMKGIFIQGEIQNINGRVYPLNEIRRAVTALGDEIKANGGVLGEVDHPANLRINLDRVSHIITDIWMDGNNGLGKLKIIPTPMGNLVKSLIDAGVKLGVSSRGSGNVNESNGNVSEFEITTVDIVAQPSAQQAYPKAIYESLLNMNGGNKLLNSYKNKELSSNARLQKMIQVELQKFISELKL